VGLLERIAKARGVEQRYSADLWLSDYMMPALSQYPYGVRQTMPGWRPSEIAATLPGYSAALRFCPPAFAAQMVRALVMSQARFKYRSLPSSPTPRKPFGKKDLALLERPWPNATTGELLARMEWHAGLGGNAFVARRPNRLRVMRPDWVAVLYGSDLEPEDAVHALDSEVLGYAYCNGGFGSGNKPNTLLPSEVAHWSPLPDPESPGLGMSWITPAVRDILGDRAATEHKLQFFSNGATPNMVVKGITAPNEDEFHRIVSMLESQHSGLANAYRTLYLTAGVDATVVGANLQQMDFKLTQGAGETRIAVLSRVPAPLLGISEGLAGSSLNAGNFGMARRMFADTWVFPTLQDVCAALAPLLSIPADAELWFDVVDVPLLREDAKDAAEIESIKGQTIRTLVDGGFTPESVVAAVAPDWVSTLVHTHLLPVQLQPPGAQQPTEKANGNAA
jgi:phage portal protein BeeE